MLLVKGERANTLRPFSLWLPGRFVMALAANRPTQPWGQAIISIPVHTSEVPALISIQDFGVHWLGPLTNDDFVGAVRNFPPLPPSHP